MTTAAPDETYRLMVEELAYKFSGVFSRESISEAVSTTRADLESTATVTDYVPLLVGRFARERLMAAAQAEGKIAKQVPELLFICVHNAGRSQMAAAWAEHLAQGRVHVRTAGSEPVSEVNPDAITVLAERGIDLTQAYPKPLTDNVVMAADVIVTMGCGDACPVYPGKHYEDWNVLDPLDQPLDVVREIRDDIQSRVATLLRNLGI